MTQAGSIQWQGRFFKRVFTRLGILLCAGMLVVGGFAWQIMQHWLREYTLEQLKNNTHLARVAVEHGWPFDSPAAIQAECAEVRALTGLRLTIIATDGRVLADSDADPAGMENHASRPEIIDALKGDMGVNMRTSTSVGQPFLYLATSLRVDGELVAFVRVAAPAEDIERRERAIKQLIITGLAVALPLALLLAWLLSRALATPIQRVSAWAQQLATGDLVTHLEVGGDDEIKQVAEALERMRRSLLTRIREAQQQRQDLEITVSSLEEGVIAVNHDGLVLVANNAARRFLGVGHSLVGGPLAEQLPQRALRRLWDEATETGVGELRRELVLEAGGTSRTVDVSMLHVTQAETPIAWLICLRDITEIAKSVAMKTDFVANASHELRTPVASIRAAVETLHEEGLDVETRGRFLAMISRNVERLQNLTEDLMYLNKVESVAMELTCTTFDPADVFASIETMFGEVMQRKDATLAVKSSVHEVHTDPRWLELVIKNLVDNAVKFIARGGRIELRCFQRGERVIFEVEDNGCGIPQEDLGRVFERFYQADKSRSVSQGGTGLGLAIVKHAVHAMRGEVTITSSVGVGTTVGFSLPRHSPAPAPAGVEAR